MEVDVEKAKKHYKTIKILNKHRPDIPLKFTLMLVLTFTFAVIFAITLQYVYDVDNMYSLDDLSAIKHIANDCSYFLPNDKDTFDNLIYTEKDVPTIAQKLYDTVSKYKDVNTGSNLIYDFNDYILYYNTLINEDTLANVDEDIATLCKYSANIVCLSAVDKESPFYDKIMNADFSRILSDDEMETVIEGCTVNSSNYENLLIIVTMLLVITILALIVMFVNELMYNKSWGADAISEMRNLYRELYGVHNVDEIY